MEDLKRKGSDGRKSRGLFGGFFKKDFKSSLTNKASALSRQAAALSADADGNVKTPEGQLLATLQTRPVFVKLISASSIIAADNNDLSDPYVVLKLGDHCATSRVEPKTLNPVWEETFAFETEDVMAAIDGGHPWIEFQVYDKDIISADDFLGQTAVPLKDLDAAGATSKAFTLPLHGMGTGGKQKYRGEIEVVVWFGAAAPAEAAAAHGCLLTLMPQPGLTSAPKVVQSRGSAVYEEPLFACVAFTIDCLEGVAAGSGQGLSPRQLQQSSAPDRAAWEAAEAEE